MTQKPHFTDQRLSPKALILWEILLCLVGIAVCLILGWLLSPFAGWRHLLIFGIGFFLLLIAFLYLPALYRSIGYSVTDRLFVYRHGVLFQKQKLIHRDRIVYVSLFHTPLIPLSGLSCLVIAMPGAKLRIPFLSRKAAEDLAQLLSPAPKRIYG